MSITNIFHAERFGGKVTNEYLLENGLIGLIKEAFLECRYSVELKIDNIKGGIDGKFPRL
jgi:hypothetical protein